MVFSEKVLVGFLISFVGKLKVKGYRVTASNCGRLSTLWLFDM